MRRILSATGPRLPCVLDVVIYDEDAGVAVRAQAFSRSGLIEQLEYGGFTPRQVDGARAVGL